MGFLVQIKIGWNPCCASAPLTLLQESIIIYFFFSLRRFRINGCVDWGVALRVSLCVTDGIFGFRFLLEIVVISLIVMIVPFGVGIASINASL